MTTSAVVLPRQDRSKPAPGVDATSIRIASGGYTADGEPSGALFYWSSTRFHSAFGFQLHPHEGFEIVTVVLDGQTGHFDSTTGQDTELTAGDVQIIRSGSGIYHRERANAGARVFQIWLDPDFTQSLQREPSYTDHPAATLVARNVGVGTVTDIIGEQGPVESRTEGLLLKRIAVKVGKTMTFGVAPGQLALIAVVDGDGTVNGLTVGEDDNVALRDVRDVAVTVTTRQGPLVAFVAILPLRPGYQPLRQRSGY